MANGATAAARAIPYPIHLAETSELLEFIPEPPWHIRFGLRAGVLMTKLDIPNGWGWNPATLGFGLVAIVAVFGFVGTLMWASYYVGQRDNEQQHMNERINQVQGTADDASKKSLYAISKVDGGDGHAATPAEKKPVKGTKKKSADSQTTE